MKWGAGVWWGGCVVAIALTIAAWATTIAIARTGEPQVLTPDQAAQHVDADTELPHARLSGVRMVCGAPKAIGAHGWVAAELGRTAMVGVVMRLDPDRICDATATGPGRIRKAKRAVIDAFGFPADVIVLELQPHESLLGWFALAIALGAFGGWGIRSGLLVMPPPPTRTRAPAPPVPAAPEHDGDPFRGTSEDDRLLRRPLRPSRAWFRREGRTALACATALWLSVILAGLWATLFTIDVLRVDRIWTTGLRATDLELAGEETSRRFLFRTTDFDVAYTDRAGGRHRGEVWFMSIALDDRVGAELRYDPEHPDDFATSFEQFRRTGRIALTVLGIALVLGVGVSGSFVARARRREVAAARETIHAGGVELVMRVVAEGPVILDGRAVATRYTLELPDGTTIVRDRPADRPPFLLHVATRRVLGLQHPQRPDVIVLLDPDLGPLDVDADERDRVRERYAAQRSTTRA